MSELWALMDFLNPSVLGERNFSGSATACRSSVMAICRRCAISNRGWVVVGVSLLLTVTSTFFFMYLFDVKVERISLGALIIAMGMLVDNGIVIAEGMQQEMRTIIRVITRVFPINSCIKSV